jgi:CBS domain containing-hemolysin-like protein
MATARDYIAIVIFIIFSAFFSGSEIAYASVNELRLKKAAEAEGGSRLSKLAYGIYSRYDDALITILIGNNLVNIASSSVATVIAISIMGDDGAWVATAVMTVIILTFGEIVPKIVAVESSFAFTHIAAIPLKILMIVTFPIVWVIEKMLGLFDRLFKKADDNASSAITEDDLETIIDTVEDEGVIDEDKAELLQSALDFDGVLAYEIITPRVDMLTIDIEDSFDEILETANSSSYTRLPVYEDTVDNIIGILHLNHFYKKLADDPESFDIRQILMPVNFVHKTMPLDDVLKEMKRRQCHMVIVTDEYGGTMGCLTMEDVLEQLVGDIWDETDEIEPEFVQTGDDTYEVDGDMRIEDFFDELDIDDRDFDDDNTTVGGWAIEMLGDYPKVGDMFEYKNLTVTVKKLQNLRVVRVGVKVWPVKEEDEEEEL